MKKVVFYGFVLFLCLAGGLTIGIIRKRAAAGGDLVISAAPTPPLMEMAAGSGSNGEMADGSSLSFDDLADDAADPDAADDPDAGADTAMADAGTADDTSATEGFSRTFGGVDSGSSGSTSSGSTTSRARASSGSSGSSGSTTETWSAPASSSVSSASTSASSDDDIIQVPSSAASSASMSNDAWAAPKRKATPEPTPVAVAEADPWEAPATATGDTGFGSGDDAGLDELPVIEGAGTGAEDPFAATAQADPFVAAADDRVAMIAPNGGGELSFPSASGRALKKVSQRVSGDKTIVHIDMSGSPRDGGIRVMKMRSGKIYIDIEEMDVPGGATSAVAGSGPHIKEISARPLTNAGGMKLARVQILLKTSEMPNVSHEKVAGGIDVVIGGARF